MHASESAERDQIYIINQGDAVGRDFDCQSCGWQIESQLGQIGKMPSASFNP